MALPASAWFVSPSQNKPHTAQDAALSKALCGDGRCDGAPVAATLAPVLPALLPAEAAEVAEAVAALRPAPPDAAQLLLLIAARCLHGLSVLLCRTTARLQADCPGLLLVLPK